MDRRNFLRLIGLGAPAVAIAAKFGLLEMEPSVNRVYSFPTQIKIAQSFNYNDLSAVTINAIIPQLVDNYYKVSPVFLKVFESGKRHPFNGGNRMRFSVSA